MLKLLAISVGSVSKKLESRMAHNPAKAGPLSGAAPAPAISRGNASAWVLAFALIVTHQFLKVTVTTRHYSRISNLARIFVGWARFCAHAVVDKSGRVLKVRLINQPLGHKNVLTLRCYGSCKNVWETLSSSSGMTMQRFLSSTTKHLLLVFFTAFSPLWLSGCAAVGESAIGKVASAAMESVGLKKSASPDAQKAPRTVQISLSAGKNLNASQNQPLAVLVKIYQLKNATTFMQAPLTNLTDAQSEKALLGTDLLEERDITLLPEQHYTVAEQVAGAADAIGVVALFHSPAPRRWKFVFDAARAEKTGIKLGVHACAMTVVAGAVLTPPGALKEEAQEETLKQLALVKCP